MARAQPGAGRTAVVLFTRDLRLCDHPALAAACEHADRVVALFVLDDAILSGRFASPNRAAFLLESLTDLRSSLRRLGGELVVRRGDVIDETLRVVHDVGASDLTCSADVSTYAQRREHRLAAACRSVGVRMRTYPGVTVVPPGELTPGGGDHYRVFTPYWRVWDAFTWRDPIQPPRSLTWDRDVPAGEIAVLGDLTSGALSPNRAAGGESQGRRLLSAAVRTAADGDPDLDDLAGDHTSRLSPYLHFGCVSPLEVATRLKADAPGQVRQLAWRDFHHQVTAAFPEIARRDYRARGISWRTDEPALEAWRRGVTGVPVVDAGMRQLLAEGWMHNRARLITASFLTKNLRINWREGAAHFFRWLVDGDVANNAGNWQWVAGTGNDTRPNRVLNPLRQARRFDPDGTYVRRHVSELAGVGGPAVHAPWRLTAPERAALGYPPPLIDV